MKISMDKNGKRTVDFMGARLPDGRSIEEILNENEKIKAKIRELKENFEASRGIVDKALDKLKVHPKHRKWIKTVIEAIDLVR